MNTQYAQQVCCVNINNIVELTRCREAEGMDQYDLDRFIHPHRLAENSFILKMVSVVVGVDFLISFSYHSEELREIC